MEEKVEIEDRAEAPRAAESADPRPRPGALAIGFLVALLLAAGSTACRVRTAFADPGFPLEQEVGALKSDPALLAYITERIEGAEGLVPDDFRADPRVEYPDRVDLAARFTVGQEFLVAWAHRALAPEVPLHIFATWFMGAVASLTLIGAFGLAVELTGSVRLALLACALWAVVPANYRTLGFVLVREDLSWPLYALHLWLLARALRRRTVGAALWATAPLLAALATWHALSFFAALEVGLFAAWYLVSGRNLFADRRAQLALVLLMLGSLAVPALRATLFALSLPVQLALALCLAALVERRCRLGGVGRSLTTLGAWLLVAGLSLAVSRLIAGGLYEYGHVFEVLLAKLRHLGARPVDPNELSFDARLLWQGPFATVSLEHAWRLLGWGLPILVVAALAGLVGWARPDRGGHGLALGLLGLVALSLPAAWLIQRAIILPGLLLPAVVALAARCLKRRELSEGLVAALVALQGIAFFGYTSNSTSSWYQPPRQSEEIAALVRWVEANVPPGEPVATDFMNGPALLLHTGRPILQQPKYEAVESRRRAFDFLDGVFHASPEEFRSLLLESYGCRFVALDRHTLWQVSRYAAGLPWSAAAPPHGSVAAFALSTDPSVLRSIPGWELVYRSPATIRFPDGRPYDFFRVWRLSDQPLPEWDR